MNIKIDTVGKCDHQTLIEIWEESVRATHNFLDKGYIKELKPLILEDYFNTVDLRCAKNESDIILGFCGVYDEKIEMLFISPKYRGRGVGAKLTDNTIRNQNAKKVDVNEQNHQAVGFYEYLGFKTCGRSELDGQGKPYPILHMELIHTV